MLVLIMSTTRVRTRTTQQERSSNTIEDLLRAARALFARNGYSATSLDAVCEAANVTKGALYHHFTNKQHLFRAVYEGEQARLATTVAKAYLSSRPDSWEAVRVGAEAFLAEVLDPDVQRINLLDAPGALGWETMREINTDCLRMMQEGVRRATESGDITPHSVPALTHLLYGALCETAMAVARADDQPAALEESVTELRALFDAVGAAR
jgi:AcrR family transcriptional regulator